MTDEPRRLRVLSIDGGGMRGLYTAAYLSSLAQRYATTREVDALDIGKGFDLITDTSTGAIIACALAAGVPLDRVAALYRERGPDIFPLKLPASPGMNLAWQTWKRPHYLKAGAAALEEALSAELGENTLGDVWRDRGSRWLSRRSKCRAIMRGSSRPRTSPTPGTGMTDSGWWMRAWRPLRLRSTAPWR